MKEESMARVGVGVAVAVVSLAILLSCAKPPTAPVSFQAEIAESVDPERVRVIAEGLGEKYDFAILEGKMTAVWRVVQELAQTPEEKSKFEANKEKVYARAKQFVESSKVIERTRTEEGKIKVKLETVVSKKRLEGFLVSMGIITPREEIIEVLEMPTMAVIPDKSVGEAEWVEFAANHVASYLTKKKFEVLNPESLDQLFEMAQQVKALEGIPEDETARIALAIGADIYITFEAKAETGYVGRDKTIKGTASVKAYETTTARLLGTATGFSKNYAWTPGGDRKVVVEALSDATDKVITNIMDYWKSDIRKGKQFLIMLYGNFRGAEGMKTRREVYSALRSITKTFKQNIATGKTLTYRVWFEGSNTELLFALQDVLGAKGIKLVPLMENRKMLQLNLQ